MPKPSPARLDPAYYFWSTEIGTRFGDLDTVGHVNNVALANLFQEARFRFDLAHASKPRIEGARPVVVSITIDYMRETFHPEPVTICCGIGRVGASSWEVHQLAIQSGRAVAACTVTMVCLQDGKTRPVPPRWREGLEAVRVNSDG